MSAPRYQPTCGSPLAVDTWGPNAGDLLTVCRPLGVEVASVDPELLRDWSVPAVADDHGPHGMQLV